MRVLPSSSPFPATGLVFHYQPVLGRAPGEVRAFEALVRHRRPDGTVAGPAEILPLLTRPENIAAFTRFTLLEAACVLRDDPGLVGLCVNLSPQQIILPDVPACLREIDGATRRRLFVELTEEEDASPPTGALLEALHAIRALGVLVFLDDLTPDRLPSREGVLPAVDGIKIDRGVIEDLLAGNAAASAFLARLLELRIPLVAEGVEDAAALPRLEALGLTGFQGFGLGRPHPRPLLVPHVAGASRGAPHGAHAAAV